MEMWCMYGEQWSVRDSTTFEIVICQWFSWYMLWVQRLYMLTVKQWLCCNFPNELQLDECLHSSSRYQCETDPRTQEENSETHTTVAARVTQDIWLLQEPGTMCETRIKGVDSARIISTIQCFVSWSTHRIFPNDQQPIAPNPRPLHNMCPTKRSSPKDSFLHVLDGLGNTESHNM